MITRTPEGGIEFTQNNFSGGMNLFGELSNISDTEYGPAFNVRNRKGSLEAVKNYLTDANAPAGLKQGIVGFSNYIVIFVAGRAWYREKNATTWTRIADFQLSTTANMIYTCEVPESTFDFERSLESDDNVSGTQLNRTLNIGITLSDGNPAGLVCQDGTNQPWLILSDGTARKLQNYDEWTITAREYVPIGTNMCFSSGILFVTNGSFILRSVTGRPLDFMVNVDQDGNKGGDAYTIAYAVSGENVTCILEITDGYIFVGGALNCHVIKFNFEDTIFDEPKFIKSKTIGAGILNQFSFVDITLLDSNSPIGDYGFIDANGLRSFNAVIQQKNEGQNSVFSAGINTILEHLLQNPNECCTVSFNNYSLFQVYTKYGYAIVVYDQTLQKWAGIDSFLATPVKQFAIVAEQDAQRLFAITATAVVELYSPDSTQYALASMHAPEFITGNPKEETKLRDVRCVFNHNAIDSTAKVTSFVNDCRRKLVIAKLKSEATGIPYPVDYPVQFGLQTRTSNTLFQFSEKAETGWRSSCVVSWSNSARLVQLQIDCDIVNTNVSMHQQAINNRT